MRLSILGFALALAAGPAFAQGPAPVESAPQQSAPAPTAMPGPMTEIIGPEGSFRLQPDGLDWERFQTVRSIGLICTKKACGEDRVFCMMQVRSAADARPGLTPSAQSAQKFGDGVVANAPKEMKTEIVEPFAERTIGANPGQWAVAKAEGEPGSLRLALFVVEAQGREIAFNCVTPGDRWDAHRARIDQALALLKITK